VSVLSYAEDLGWANPLSKESYKMAIKIPKLRKLGSLGTHWYVMPYRRKKKHANIIHFFIKIDDSDGKVKLSLCLTN
jgi:hypothetical protein